MKKMPKNNKCDFIEKGTAKMFKYFWYNKLMNNLFFSTLIICRYEKICWSASSLVVFLTHKTNSN